MSTDAGLAEEATRELLARVRMGDWLAEKQLFDAHRSALANEAERHRLMPLLAATRAADDLVGDVWLRCYSTSALENFEDRGSGSLLRFLRVVLERVMIDHVRRLTAECRGGSQALEPLELSRDDGAAEGDRGLHSREPTPTSRAREKELMELCRAVLDADEWSVWQAVELVRVDIESVAATRGCTVSAVRGVLYRARRKLMRSLEARANRQSPA